MGNAFLYWWPKPDGPVEGIDLGEGLSDLQRTVLVEQVAVEAISGVESVNRFNSRSRIRVVLERFTDKARARQLRALENYLQRGGIIGVAEDSDKAVAGFLVDPLPDRGAALLQVNALPFPYSPSADVAEGDTVVVQSASPSYQYEETVISAPPVVGSLQFAVEPIQFDYTEERWALFRHRGFWPLMRVPLAARTNTFLTHDHRISWTFDVPLEEVNPALEAVAVKPNQTVLDSVADLTLGWTPNSLVGLDEEFSETMNRMGLSG